MTVKIRDIITNLMKVSVLKSSQGYARSDRRPSLVFPRQDNLFGLSLWFSMTIPYEQTFRDVIRH